MKMPSRTKKGITRTIGGRDWADLQVSAAADWLNCRPAPNLRPNQRPTAPPAGPWFLPFGNSPVPPAGFPPSPPPPPPLVNCRRKVDLWASGTARHSLPSFVVVSPFPPASSSSFGGLSCSVLSIPSFRPTRPVSLYCLPAFLSLVRRPFYTYIIQTLVNQPTNLPLNL
ncbi:hypothetical protein VTO42DRAFT_2179 [Malbranchea cinnamomea]